MVVFFLSLKKNLFYKMETMAIVGIIIVCILLIAIWKYVMMQPNEYEFIA
jgi:hypothetical protein